MEVSGGADGMDQGVLTLNGGVARADSGHDCFFVVCTRVRSREKKVIVLDRGMQDGGEREIKRQVKARQARSARYNAQYSRASASRREKWDVAQGSSGGSRRLLSCQDSVKTIVRRWQPNTIRSVARLYTEGLSKVSPPPDGAQAVIAEISPECALLARSGSSRDA
jgi:hypothetical protein